MEIQETTSQQQKQTILYAVITGVVFFILGLMVFFPSGMIIEKLLKTLEKEGHFIEFNGSGLSPLTGSVTLENVRYSSDRFPVTGVFSRVKASVSLLALAARDKLDSKIGIKNPVIEIAGKTGFEKIQIMRGEMAAKAEATQLSKFPAASSGSFDLQYSGGKIHITGIPMLGSLTATIHALTAEGTLAKGFIQLTSGKTILRSNLARVTASGRIPVLKNGAYDVRILVLLQEEFFTEMQESAGVDARMLLNTMGYLSPAGEITLHVTGLINSPSVKILKPGQ